MESKASFLAFVVVLITIMLSASGEPSPPATAEKARAWASGEDGRLESFLLKAKIVDVRPVGEFLHPVQIAALLKRRDLILATAPPRQNEPQRKKRQLGH